MSAGMLIFEIRGDGEIVRWVWLHGGKTHMLGCNAVELLARTPACKLPARAENDGRDNLIRAGLAYQAMTAAYLQHEGMEARRQYRALDRKGITPHSWRGA